MRFILAKSSWKSFVLGLVSIAASSIGSQSKAQEDIPPIETSAKSISASASCFEEEILPILTRHGCNSGACHGAASGRGFLHLSLFGSDPTADHYALIEEFQGRRVRFSDPESSLLVAKPTGRIAHGGDVVIDPEGPDASALLKWIASGAPRGEPSQMQSLVLNAEELQAEGTASPFRLQAMATFRHGAQRDVTHLAQFLVDPSSSVKWNGDSGVATLDTPGREVVLARYMGRVATVTLKRRFGRLEAVDAIEDTEHWIDRCLSGPLHELGVSPNPVIDDLSWFRRASLDLTGRLPTLEWMDEFEKDDATGRKQRWIERMLSTDAYTDVWTLRLSRWLELRSLPNDAPAMQAYAAWIRREVAEDRSMREVARELLTATGDSHAIGPANFARMSSDARSHAELVSRVFLGTRLQCANCHNHPLDRWTQDDYHGFSSVFSVFERGRHVRWLERGDVTNLRTREPAQPRIPGVRDLPSNALTPPGSNVLAFADWMLSEDNPVFARVLVNRIWHTMIGHGIVDPVDDFRDTNPPSNPELLDALVDHFRKSGYRLRPLIFAIAESRVYSRSIGRGNVVPVEVPPSLFASAISRRLEPEVLLDAVHDALGVPYSVKLGKTNQEDTIGVDRISPLRAVHELDPAVPHSALDMLGRCKRPSACEARTEGLGLAEQLHWLNGDVVNRLLESGETFFDRMLVAESTDEEILRAAYMRTLSRQPAQRELEIWLPRIPTARDARRAWYQDWVWSMLSSSDFLANR
ncbi:MAG: DUF1553 domain-containing protein [Pirellula sp.]